MANGPVLPRQRLAAALLALGMLIALSQAGALGQEQGVDSITWKRGYNGLAMLCRAAGLRIDRDLQSWREIPASQSMLIILGSTRGLPIDFINYVSRGGAVLVASDQRDFLTLLPWGVALNRGPHHAAAATEMFRTRSDCPVASRLDAEHPVTQGCRSLVTNRPGLLALRSDSASKNPSRRTIASLPLLRGQPRTSGRRTTEGPALAVALQWNVPARALCVADQSMFSNQMLTCGDNANFAINAISWLRDNTRTHVLIIADREITDPTNPEQLFVLVPPPNPEDVIAALEELPPEALIAFSNSVIAAVEDEGVINDVFPDIIDEIPRRLYLRVVVLLMTVVLFAYLAFRLFYGRAEWLDAAAANRRDPARARFERKQAAAVLLDQFCSDVSGGISRQWDAVLNCLRVDGDPRDTKKLRRQIAGEVRRSRQRSTAYWTRRRLVRLQEKIARWRQLQASGLLEYDSG